MAKRSGGLKRTGNEFRHISEDDWKASISNTKTYLPHWLGAGALLFVCLAYFIHPPV